MIWTTLLAAFPGCTGTAMIRSDIGGVTYGMLMQPMFYDRSIVPFWCPLSDLLPCLKGWQACTGGPCSSGTDPAEANSPIRGFQGRFAVGRLTKRSG